MIFVNLLSVMIKTSIHKLVFACPLIMFSLLSFGQDKVTEVCESLHPYYFHLRYLTDSTSILFDVREFREYRRYRIKDAINVPSALEMETLADTTSKERSVFIYCDDNFRSITAAEILVSRGFSRVYSLEGGLILWKKENMPVERIRLKRSRK